jgi:hypothetical protein
MALSDGDRRKTFTNLWLTNPGQVFQIAYGLKRGKYYDLLRAYVPPAITDIVMYGSYSFTIKSDKLAAIQNGELSTNGAPHDPLMGLYLSAHRYLDSDKRDSATSSYINWHTAGTGAKRWKFTPVNSIGGGVAFYIALAADDVRADGIDQTNWLLTAQRFTAFDKMSPTFSHAFIAAPPVATNTWVLRPVDRGEAFVISLAYDAEVLDGISQTGWCLDFNIADGLRSGDSNTFEASFYATYNNLNVAGATYRSVKIDFSG